MKSNEFFALIDQEEFKRLYCEENKSITELIILYSRKFALVVERRHILYCVARLEVRKTAAQKKAAKGKKSTVIHGKNKELVLSVLGEKFLENATPATVKELWVVHGEELPMSFRTFEKILTADKPVKEIRLFFDVYPHLRTYWDEVKNSIEADLLLGGATKSRYWLCSRGHSVVQSPVRVANLKEWCSYCSNRKLLTGFNDLASQYPEIALDWNEKKNSMGPEEIIWGSSREVHWCCHECGFEWSSTVRSRTMGGSRCPICSKAVSYHESLVQEFLGELGVTFIANSKPLTTSEGKRRELDLLLPVHGLAIEVQDFATHSRVNDSEPLEGVWSYYGEKTGEKFKKGPTYHALKRALAWEQLGVELVEVWQDDIESGAYKELLKESLTKNKGNE